MADRTYCKQVVIPHMQLKLAGVSIATARAVADALPSAVAAEMHRSDVPVNAPLTVKSGRVGDVTQALAREVAARVRAGIRTQNEEES